MCGIAGAAWRDDDPGLAADCLEAMTARLAHRGPDDSGAHRDGNVALGFRRLAIVDLVGSRQPLSNEEVFFFYLLNFDI